MSRRSRKRNKVLAAIALGLGASKLGMLGGKSTASSVVGKTPEFRKSFVKDKALPIAKPSVAKKIPGKMGKDVISSGPFKMFGVGKKFSDESIAKYKAANEKMRNRRKSIKMGKSDRTDVPGFFGMKFDKPLFNKGSMVKARGGGMARTKPTKLS